MKLKSYGKETAKLIINLLDGDILTEKQKEEFIKLNNIKVK